VKQPEQTSNFDGGVAGQFTLSHFKSIGKDTNVGTQRKEPFVWQLPRSVEPNNRQNPDMENFQIEAPLFGETKRYSWKTYLNQHLTTFPTSRRTFHKNKNKEKSPVR
jgi:hypothetical protein